MINFSFGSLPTAITPFCRFPGMVHYRGKIGRMGWSRISLWRYRQVFTLESTYIWWLPMGHVHLNPSSIRIPIPRIWNTIPNSIRSIINDAHFRLRR
jgi:hypothetical protein